MTKTTDILTRRLSDKDLMLIEVSRLIKDAVNMIGDRGESTVASVNQKLESLGWGRNILELFSFELISFFRENDHRYKVVESALPENFGSEHSQEETNPLKE